MERQKKNPFTTNPLVKQQYQAFVTDVVFTRLLNLRDNFQVQKIPSFITKAAKSKIYYEGASKSASTPSTNHGKVSTSLFKVSFQK